MKLTRTDKDAFISAVIQDIPKVDYQEQYRALLQEDAIAQLPAKIQAIARDKELRHFLRTGVIWGRGNMSSVAVYEGHGTNFKPTPAVSEKVDQLIQLRREQGQRLEDMRLKLNAAIAPCATLKMALERLPEFAKYLPEAREKSVYLPSIANLVADLSTLGWPKDQAKATTVKEAPVATGPGTVIAV